MKELNEKNIKKFLAEWSSDFHSKRENDYYVIYLPANKNIHVDFVSMLEEEFGPLNCLIDPILGFDLHLRENHGAAKVKNVKPLNEKNLNKYAEKYIPDVFVKKLSGVDEYIMRVDMDGIKKQAFLHLEEEFGPLNWAIKMGYTLQVKFEKKEGGWLNKPSSSSKDLQGLSYTNTKGDIVNGN